MMKVSLSERSPLFSAKIQSTIQFESRKLFKHEIWQREVRHKY